MSLTELGVETGGELTELLSHIYTSHHLDLVCRTNCSNDLCIVLDVRYALHLSCKFTYSNDTDQGFLTGVMATSTVIPSVASTTAVFPTT